MLSHAITLPRQAGGLGNTPVSRRSITSVVVKAISKSDLARGPGSYPGEID